VDTIASNTITVWILASIVMAAGSALQAAFGMGLALFVVPLLALIDPRLIPGPMLFAAIGLCIAMAHEGRAKIVRRDLGISVVGLLIGTVVGAIALALVAEGNLSRVFGAMILLAVLISVSGATLRSTAPALLAGGTAAGVMGVMVGVHGPPVALVFQNDGPARARAMLGAFFAVAYPLSIAAMVPVGFFGMAELRWGIALIPGVALGYLLAPVTARRTDHKRLRWGILAISAASGIVLVLR
jgi:uncharacterized protein